MISQSKLNHAIIKAEEVLNGFELEFFKRIWSTDISKFEKRLEALKFEGYEKVLDAGFGNAQWTICLANKNKFVDGIEYTTSRVKVGQILENELGIKNTKLIEGSVENLPYQDNTFDAVFCYGVIFLTDINKSLKEINRVLKPGGKLYFTANSLGWYLMCLIEEHNKSENYDPRLMAAETINHSFNYFTKNKSFEVGKQLFITKPILENILKECNFVNTDIRPEGMINLLDPDAASLSFYKHTSYLNQDFIYDVVCYKSNA